MHLFHHDLKLYSYHINSPAFIYWFAATFAAGRVLRIFNTERMAYMRFCFRQVFSLILGALVLAILVFVLLFTGLITLIPTAVSGFVFFTLVSVLAGGGLLVLTTSVLQADRTPALINAWLCCGDLAGAAAIGAIFSSLITSLTVSLGIGLYIGVALVFFFLFLFLGSLLCLLRRYVTTCTNCNR